jgi:hypothetical protein
MEHVGPAVLAPMVAATLVVFGVLFVLGRGVGHGIVLLDRLLARRLPRLVAHTVTAALFLVAAVVVTRDVVADGFFDWANRRFAAVDATTDPGVTAPSSPAVSGSPASLVPWATLGEYGRSFVAQTTSPDRLRAFHGAAADVTEPIRVYVGLRSAGSPDERAALAVRELERTGAFRREVLAVVTVTGTGWVDPDAASAVEYLHGGDTALVGLQYSYLPSWISFLVDRDEAAEAGTALYRHVHRRWSELPAESRPRLIIFGESLGSYGAEAAFGGPDAAASLANLVAGADGALFTGPPRPTGSGTSSPTTVSRAAPCGAPSTATAPGSGSPTGLPTWNAPTRPGRSRASSTCTIPRTRSGTGAPTRSGGGPSGPSPQGLRHPRPCRLVPDRHRGPGGGRPDRRLQRPLRLRAQLRRRLRERLGGRRPTGAVDGGRQRPAPAAPRARVRLGSARSRRAWHERPGRDRPPRA